MARYWFLWILPFVLDLNAQTPKYEISCQNESLSTVFQKIEKKYGFKFSYDPQLIHHYMVHGKITAYNGKNFLEKIIKAFPLKFKKVKNLYLLLPDKTKPIGSAHYLGSS